MWRSNRGVHRTTGPWTATVHAFLHHLDNVGFAGAPVAVLGMDGDGREVLGFIDGEVLADPAWQPGRPTPWPGWAQSEECLVASARLLRSAARRVEIVRATGRTPSGASTRAPVLGVDEIVCHGDVGPHNTVYRRGLPVAFIDWDVMRPNDPLVEFGNAAWHFVPLGNDAVLRRERVPESARSLGTALRVSR